MAVKIRLQRRGRKKRPFYQIVVADARSPRDGRFIEKIGTYNPMTKPATIEIDRDKAYDWVLKGAQPTDTVRAILRFKGVYYKKHLMRGVKKGALTPEEAEQKYQEWITAKDEKTAKRVEKAKEEIAMFNAKVAGLEYKPVNAPVIEEEVTAEEVAEIKVEAAAEEVVEAAEAVAEEAETTEAEAEAPEATETTEENKEEGTEE